MAATMAMSSNFRQDARCTLVYRNFSDLEGSLALYSPNNAALNRNEYVNLVGYDVPEAAVHTKSGGFLSTDEYNRRAQRSYTSG